VFVALALAFITTTLAFVLGSTGTKGAPWLIPLVLLAITLWLIRRAVFYQPDPNWAQMMALAPPFQDTNCRFCDQPLEWRNGRQFCPRCG